MLARSRQTSNLPTDFYNFNNVPVIIVSNSSRALKRLEKRFSKLFSQPKIICEAQDTGLRKERKLGRDGSYWMRLHIYPFQLAIFASQQMQCSRIGSLAGCVHSSTGLSPIPICPSNLIPQLPKSLLRFPREHSQRWRFLSIF
jgi:hypothetical protein